MESRDFNVTLRNRAHGQPCRIMLHHRRTGLEAEGEGEDYAAARAAALELLERDVTAADAAGTAGPVGRA